MPMLVVLNVPRLHEQLSQDFQLFLGKSRSSKKTKFPQQFQVDIQLETINTHHQLSTPQTYTNMAALKRKKEETAAASTTLKKAKTSKAAAAEPKREKEVEEKATEKLSKLTIKPEKEKKERKGKKDKKEKEFVKELVKSKEVEVVIETKPKGKKEKKTALPKPLPKPLPKAKVAQKIVDEEVSESDDWSSDNEEEGEEFIGGGEEDAEGDVSMEEGNTNGMHRTTSTYPPSFICTKLTFKLLSFRFLEIPRSTCCTEETRRRAQSRPTKFRNCHSREADMGANTAS